MAVDLRLRSSGVPRRMGPAAFTLASTVESITGGYNHRLTAVYGTEAVPMPAPDTTRDVPPGVLPLGTNSLHDRGVMYPAWSVVAPALPGRVPRPTGHQGLRKPAFGGFVPAGNSLPADLVVQPQLYKRTGAGQGRVTTAPKAQLRWVRQGG
jgi:hypothetical protein